jgi:hypothetical protein
VGGTAGAGNSNVPGNGGSGVTSSIPGSAVERAGGGGGMSRTTSGTATGGGGAGASSASGSGISGTANTGGGGGGAGGDPTGSSGAGGSGVVIFRIPSTAPLPTFSGGVTQTNTVVGPWRVYTVTATSTISETVTIS